jgi:hypothetical protein
MARDGALMATAFDPSRFIEAEASRQSQPLADVASDGWDWGAGPKMPETRDKHGTSAPTVATIATLAGPDTSGLPFDRDVRCFVEQPCPRDLDAERWDELTAEVWGVHRNWAALAVGVGWSSLDLFGCNPDPFARRVDRDGLVATIVGLRSPVRLVEITSAYAELACVRGASMRYRPPPAPGAVHIWEAYRMWSGP